MIIENQADVTQAVEEAVSRVEDERLREILLALVRHLHGFVREVRLTEREFGEAVRVIAALGQKTTASHNEVMLMAGSLGVSPLVCLLNNGNHGESETQANMLGPFWRDDQPACKSGDSLVRSPTPGAELFVSVSLEDANGQPVAGAEVDVWHSSPVGMYENQDPNQADMNLRGKFFTDADGRFFYRSTKPGPYPVPVDGPVGDMLRAQLRHCYRPAHFHFLAFKEGFKTLVTQVFVADDQYLHSDVVFGVTTALVGDYRRHPASEKPPADDVTGDWYSFNYDLIMEPGDAKLPIPPIK